MFRSTLRLSKLPLLATSGLGVSASFCDAKPQTKEKFDLIVIGGGSGGLACAKRAAGYGAKVAIIEGGRYGGTCVNVGCVPKKVMYNASHVMEAIAEADNFGVAVEKPKFDWATLKQYRDRYIQRLNGIYEGGLDKLKITRVAGMAEFASEDSVKVTSPDGGDGGLYQADNVLIAVGGTPRPLGVPGQEHVIDSDAFFSLETQPKKVAVLGAGYIAVELAGVFNGLGTDTSLFVRKHCALREFDEMISSHLDATMKKSGIKVHPGSVTEKVVKEQDGTLTLHLKNGEVHGGFDQVLSATGRVPLTPGLQLHKANITTLPSGHIPVDAYQNTTTKGVLALGDVCGRVELTPMAIAAGRRVADRLFGGMPDAKVDYDLVPTVVFSHPVIGTIGLTEKQAREKYPEDELKVYTSTFVNLYYGTYLRGEGGSKPLSRYKVVCQGPNQKVVGIHAIGMGSDEMLQGFGVAMKMGLTKADLDRCVAIHPTAAEEMVTLAPWGLSE